MTALHDLPDFQVYRTQAGRLLAIDAGGLANKVGAKSLEVANSVDGSYTSFRLRQLMAADIQAVGIPYLEELRAANPSAWEGLTAAIADEMSSQSGRSTRVFGGYVDYLLEHGLGAF